MITHFLKRVGWWILLVLIRKHATQHSDESSLRAKQIAPVQNSGQVTWAPILKAYSMKILT